MVEASQCMMGEIELDTALKAMTIEEDRPLILKSNPKFSSCERNAVSLMGRLLNPPSKKISSMILDMPRMWRLYQRVRGVALSHDRFQFIFNSKADLNTVLDSGAWTYNEWSMVMERWVAKPSDNYLTKIPLWVRLRNILVNYYTAETIQEIGEEIRQVVEVAYDPEKP